MLLIKFYSCVVFTASLLNRNKKNRKTFQILVCLNLLVVFFPQVGAGTHRAGRPAWPPACSWLKSAWRTHRRHLRSLLLLWRALRCLHRLSRQVSKALDWSCEFTLGLLGFSCPKYHEVVETCLFLFAVLRRIKVTFLDTIVRIEHQPPGLKTGVALEVHIERWAEASVVYKIRNGEKKNRTASKELLIRRAGST